MARSRTQPGPHRASHNDELIGIIATYNMVSRFLVALELHPA